MKRFELFNQKSELLINELAEQWFDPNIKLGDFYRYCPHCDIEVGESRKHRDDCILELAKKTKQALAEIPHEPSLLREEVEKSRVFVIHFYQKKLLNAVPIDPIEANSCECQKWNVESENKHRPNCSRQKMAENLSILYKVS